MAFPTSFAKSNAVLGEPAHPSCIGKGDDCECLSILRSETVGGTPVVVSCWKLTAAELEEVNRTGRVWLICVGCTMPPVSVDGCRPMLEEFQE